jgi:hypothetical protein
MIEAFRPHNRWLPALLFLSFLVAHPAARAQDDDEEEIEAPVEGVVQQPVWVMSDPQFDQWVFGAGGGNAAAAHSRLESLLRLQVEDLARACKLSDDQKSKLRLAGRGDIKRYFDQVEQARRKYRNKQYNQNEIGQVFQEIQPLQAPLRTGVFGDDSIYRKVVRKVMTPEQVADYENSQRELRAFRYRARIELVVATLGRSVGMSAEQRRRFAKVLNDETRAPREFGQNDYQVALLQAAKVSEEKLKPIFDEAQWRVLGKHFEQVRALEPVIRQNGYVPDGDEPGAAKPAAPKGVGGDIIFLDEPIRIQVKP